MNETIVALATAHGTGSISVVRVSGGDSLTLALKLIRRCASQPAKYCTKNPISNLDASLSTSTNLKPSLNDSSGINLICEDKPEQDGLLNLDKNSTGKFNKNPNLQSDPNFTLKPRYATLCNIYTRKNEFIDEAIVIYFKAPHSFSGEDIVEFQTHGGFMVAAIIIDELVALGARLANPGEFSKRAFINGKMDLAKAETIAALISARSEGAAKILARSLQGELQDYVSALRNELVKTLAFVETCIDYAEEDLPKDILASTQNLLKENSVKLTDIVDISQQRKGLIDGFKVAIIGKPNVGKSSILNSLLRYERAIISDEAGTTRDRIEESLKIDTHLIKIIDTAGIREDAGKIESIGIEHSLKAANEADIVIAVFDSSEICDSEDEKILEICANLDKKLIYILNKSDLPSKFEKTLPGGIKISAKTSTGKIIKELKTYLDMQNYDGLMLSSQRQITACTRANEAIRRAANLLNESELELFAYELNLAIGEISSITRPYDRSEILDEMFSHFCLGK